MDERRALAEFATLMDAADAHASQADGEAMAHAADALEAWWQQRASDAWSAAGLAVLRRRLNDHRNLCAFLGQILHDALHAALQGQNVGYAVHGQRVDSAPRALTERYG